MVQFEGGRKRARQLNATFGGKTEEMKQRFELLDSVSGTEERTTPLLHSIGVYRRNDLKDSGPRIFPRNGKSSFGQRCLRLDSEQLSERQGSRVSGLHSLQENTEPGVVADLSRLQEPYRDRVYVKFSSKAGASAPGS